MHVACGDAAVWRRAVKKLVWRLPFCRHPLAGSEIAFRRGGCMVFQMQLAKEAADSAPITRDYILDFCPPLL